MKRSPLSLAALAAALTVVTGAALAADRTLKLQEQERQQTQLQTQLRTPASDGTPSADTLQPRTQTQARLIPGAAGGRMGAGGGAGHAKGR